MMQLIDAIAIIEVIAAIICAFTIPTAIITVGLQRVSYAAPSIVSAHRHRYVGCYLGLRLARQLKSGDCIDGRQLLREKSATAD